MGQTPFKELLRQAIARKGISHYGLGKLTDPDSPELGRRRVQRHLAGTEPTAASRRTYARTLDAPELLPDAEQPVEGHRFLALVEEPLSPGRGGSSANASEAVEESPGGAPTAASGGSSAVYADAASWPK